MKLRKLCLLLLLVFCSFAIIGCGDDTEKCPETPECPKCPETPIEGEKKNFTVKYYSLTVSEKEVEEEEGEEAADEEAAPVLQYSVAYQGKEVVEEGSKITGIAVDDSGTKYIAPKYYLGDEAFVGAGWDAKKKEFVDPATEGLEEGAVTVPSYDPEAPVTRNMTLYAVDGTFAVYQELATGSGYTLNYAITEFPTTWNSHIYETDTDSTILGYISTGFYEFDYNETKDGFVWADGIAVGDPVDVTDQYDGETNPWGIEEGSKARAWEITLRSDLSWDDGTPIDSNTFIESATRLLNPVAQNSRADDYTYSGNFVVHNAENYVLQGSEIDRGYGVKYATYQEAVDAGEIPSLDLKLVDSVMANDWNLLDLASLMKNYYESHLVPYFTIFTGEEGARTPVLGEDGKPLNFFKKYDLLADEDGKIPMTQEMWTDYSNCDGWNPDPDGELGLLCSIPVEYPAVSFDDVGIKATAPNKIVYILDQELSGFYLKYSLSTYLVKTDVYDACDNLDANGKLPEGEAYKNTYCTTAANSPSYGPYKLAQYQLNKYFRIEKNDSWWAYKDAANQGLYQTTAVVYTKADSASTRLQMFLSGQFDSYGLTADDMDEYQTSDYTYFTDGDSTWFLAFNPDLTAFENGEYEYTKDGEGNLVKGKKLPIDKQILYVKEFRQALSFALNRAEYELACDPTGNVAKALFSPTIISDPEKGTAYRTTEQAKKAIVKFWGLEDQIGADKLYATIDDAIDSITGYNLAMAKEYFNTAYDKAVAAGYIAEGDVVEILIGTPNLTSNYYNKGYDFLVNCYTEAVKGTKLENKLTFKRDGTLGNSFGDALRNNNVDMLFGVGWTGSALDPYGLVTVYTTYDNRYNADTDFSTTMMDVELPRNSVEGEDAGTEYASYTCNVADWTDTLSGKKITVTKTGTEEKFECSFGTTADYTVRGIILAAVELAALNQYDMIPIAYESTAALKSMKIEFYTEEYIYGVGRGGIKYTKFNYTDAEWAAFVASQKGKLNYKASEE